MDRIRQLFESWINLTQLPNWTISAFRPETGWSLYEEIEKAKVASGSMISGESALSGRLTGHTMSRSWTITDQKSCGKDRKETMVMILDRPATGWRMERVTTHPGVILNEDFLKPMEISANALALRTRMPATRIGQILRARRSVTPDTALRLARCFGTSAELWLNFQSAHDLSKARIELESAIEHDVQPLQLEAV